MTLKWDYIEKYVDVSIPGYIPAMLHHSQHIIPVQRQDEPHSWTKPTYGAKLHYAPNTNNSLVLSATKIRHIQSAVGTLLYYALAVDSTMLVAIGSISGKQSKSTAKIQNHATYLWTILC